MGTKLRTSKPTQMKLKSESAKIPCSPNGVGQFLLVGGSSHRFLPGKKISNDSFPQNVDQMTCRKFPLGYPALLGYPMSLKILNLFIYTLLETKWKMQFPFGMAYLQRGNG